MAIPADRRVLLCLLRAPCLSPPAGYIEYKEVGRDLEEGIKAADSGQGVLLIVKNYAGDIMNFEMGKEIAEMEEIAKNPKVIAAYLGE